MVATLAGLLVEKCSRPIQSCTVPKTCSTMLRMKAMSNEGSRRHPRRRFQLGAGRSLGNAVARRVRCGGHQDRVAGKRAGPVAEHDDAETPRGQSQYLGELQRHQRQQEKPKPQCPYAKGPGDRQAADRDFRHRHREFQLARFAQLGSRLRGAVPHQAGHRLCVDVGLRPYRPDITITRRSARWRRRCRA